MATRTNYEIADVIQQFGASFVAQYKPNAYTVRVLDALLQCRTTTLGGHRDLCDSCAHERFSYNSCGNRHCPKCQISKQMLWAEDRMNDALNVKHFHVVFTVPDTLHEICQTDSKAFYSAQFACAWDTLRTFGYTKYGVETGAIILLHTWGKQLSLHPHLHCLVPAVGLTLQGKLKHITEKGNYLYDVHQLSATFRGKLKQQLKKANQLTPQHQQTIDLCYNKPWVVHCEAPLGNAKQIVGYLAQYTHRVAISNKHILNINQKGVTFLYKDYKDAANVKPTTLDGVEFLRRFCMHILPQRFVKIRYYGILGSRYKKQVQPLKDKPDITKPLETRQERVTRLTGFDACKCPRCKTGTMITVEELPKIRSPINVLYPNNQNLKIKFS
jgi:Putative transposase/Transposase zinc-binding domain